MVDRSLLIADDDAALRVTLREVFEPRGFRTILASDGKEAITILENTPVDCLLIDMHMPILSGLEAVRILRSWRATLPCVMMTADDNPATREQAMRLRIYRVLIKPVRRDLVTTTVHDALAAQAG